MLHVQQAGGSIELGHAPVALHVGVCGGRLAYFGCCNAEPQFVAAFQDFCKQCNAPQIKLGDDVEEPEHNKRTPHVANMSTSLLGCHAEVDEQVQEYMEPPQAGFLSDLDVWSWFQKMQKEYPSAYGANDHPYNGDSRQHALETKLKDRTGLTYTIVGSSFRTICGDSPRGGVSLPLSPMYKVIIDGDPESAYVYFDNAHGPEAQFKPLVISYEQRIMDQRKASKAKDNVMRKLFLKLNSSEAKTKELECAAAVSIDQDPSCDRACEKSQQCRWVGPARRKRKSHHQRRREKQWKNSVQIPTPIPYDL